MLLVFQVLIARNEGVERSARQFQELAVAPPFPALVGNGAHLDTAVKATTQPVVEILIQQHAHGLPQPGPPAKPARGTPPLAPGSRWETPPKSHRVGPPPANGR